MPDKAKSSRRKTISLKSNISTETTSVLYQSLLSFYIHQDQLYWNSTQLLIVVQAGILAAGYNLRTTWLGPFISFIGALITLVLLLLVLKYGWDRDVVLPLLDKLGRDILPGDIKSELIKEGYQEPFIRLSSTYLQPKLLRIIRGKYIIRGILLALIITDIALAVLYIWCPYIFPIGP